MGAREEQEMSHVTEAAEKLEQGNRSEALRLLSMARQAAPRTCLALGEIAVLYQRAGEVGTAERVYCEALQAPHDESTYYALLSLAGMLRQQKRPREAAQVLKSARQVARTVEQAAGAARAGIDAAIDAQDYPGAIEDLLFLQRQPDNDGAAIQSALQTLYATEFHKWYYDSRVWQQTTYHGVGTYKFPSDMWNYQEILCELAPALVIEFGTLFGGATLFYADTMASLDRPFKLLTVDVNHDRVPAKVRENPNIELLTCSSADPRVAVRITELRAQHPGKAFVIVDSDHSRAHVSAELELLRGVLVSGDYLIVEDTNLNGHPVRADFGPGPYEALMEYIERHPDDYARDERRERKFGFTAAPRGFLIRR
jgi:cephalosporin hydroxylase